MRLGILGTLSLALMLISQVALAETVRIGFVTTLTGGAGAIGNDMRDAVELALDHLGRKMGDSDVTAWLYVIAEPLLRKYSQRIADDLPKDQAMLQTQKLNLRLEQAGSNQMSSTQKGESAADNGPPLSAENINEREMLSLEPPLLTLSFSEYYRQHLLSLI